MNADLEPMKASVAEKEGNRSFVIDKWFLDFVDENGLAMIFYSARISWKGLSLPYVSWLFYHPDKGISRKHRYYDARIPSIDESRISWNDRPWKIEGRWTSAENRVSARLYESDKGNLDWYCHQQSSQVEIRIRDEVYRGRGYLEQLRLTAYPWEIPLRDLRWGRFASERHSLVWISFSGPNDRSWIWYNGREVEPGLMEDDRIEVPGYDLELIARHAIVLESEKKIRSVVQQLNNYLPGFERIVPAKYLMADEIKWLSRGTLYAKGEELCSAPVIHERVRFNSE